MCNIYFRVIEMKKYYSVLVVILVLFFTVSALAEDRHGYGEMRPLEYERLAKPVSLSGLCKKVQIIEWKPTPGYERYTTITQQAVGVVDGACNMAIKNFYIFIDSKGIYSIDKTSYLDTSISFIPADMRRGGDSIRSLNDVMYRFVNRQDKDPLWGFYQRRCDWAYITNDVLRDNGKVNPGFILVVVHELFHAMSYTTGVFNQHRPEEDREEIEEKLAQQFTAYLGLGRSRSR